MSKTRFWTFVLRGLVVLAIFGVGYLVRAVTSPAGRSRPTRTGKIITVADGTAAQTIPASGTIEPATERTVSFATSGAVNAVNVAVGQSVTSGQQLATLQTAPLAATVAQDQAQLASAQAKLSVDEAAGAASTTINADNAEVSAATYSLSIAQANLGDATLRAPISGTIVSNTLVPGLQVSGTVNAAGVAPGITIISPNSWMVEASVSDASIAGVTKGEQAKITPQGSTTTVYGTVTSVGLVATTTGGVASFPVTIAITGSPTGLYTGLPANIFLITRVQANVIEVPILAVHSLTSHPYVIVEKGKTKSDTPVTLGPIIGANVIVSHGLSVGQRILERIPSFAKSLGVPGPTGRGAKRGAKGGGGLGGL
ncbi:efflux RND transporter periplasmic adaptor subunit [Ferrimicrobium acidiphilum]|uniref:Macrolide export protein MacA n=1 Tax=Ferrimicrobium acidiphilum DSM 19497 TaxID=1121877 RepID=A0A0D8FQC7_9ACTN|nr:HlyD family efflux transporter periplasmic adaptor subunit [Ferrimicrobium acidiphilum]KJE75478.1 macrolide export protein MacA [Ferrimicrobium acidiphilum DSM 19497]